MTSLRLILQPNIREHNTVGGVHCDLQSIIKSTSFVGNYASVT